MDKTQNKYTSISIPIELYNLIKEIVKKSPRYTSVSEFTKEALRDKIKEATSIDRIIRKKGVNIHL